MNVWSDYIVLIGVLLTFIATLISIYYTRKSIRSTKYIDTITSERIKWIEKLRLEIADLYSCLLTIIKNKDLIIRITDSNEKSDMLLVGINTLHQTRQLKEENSTFSTTDIHRKISTVRLRLNPVGDEEIFNCLDELSAFLLNQNLTLDAVQKAWEINFKMLSLTQIMLKQEWENVKKEAKS